MIATYDSMRLMSPLFWPSVVSVGVVIVALIFRHALFVAPLGPTAVRLTRSD